MFLLLIRFLVPQMTKVTYESYIFFSVQHNCNAHEYNEGLLKS